MGENFNATPFISTPYEMGYFDTIVRENCSSFSIGMRKQSTSFELSFKKEENEENPMFNQLIVKDGNENCKIDISEDQEASSLYALMLGQRDAPPVLKSLLFATVAREARSLKEAYSLMHHAKSKEKATSKWSNIANILMKINAIQGKCYSIAPVRSKPKRTYDVPHSLGYDPEGGDIPFLLKRMKNTKAGGELIKKLKQFGQISGLFSDIEIKQYGELGDPFQLYITVRKSKANIVDTGYGVSQILPILVHIFREESSGSNENKFLLQQPEEHLHPKAQAALTSTFY